MRGDILGVGHHKQDSQTGLGDQRIAECVVLKGHFHVYKQICALINVILAAVQEGTDGLMTAEDFKAFAKRIVESDFRGAFSGSAFT